jgi:hypothetical protein
LFFELPAGKQACFMAAMRQNSRNMAVTFSRATATYLMKDGKVRENNNENNENKENVIMKTKNFLHSIAPILLVTVPALVGCMSDPVDRDSPVAVDEKALSQADQPAAFADGKLARPDRPWGKHGKLPDPSKLDTNADGYLSFDEASVMPFMDEEHFAKMDRDGDGRVALDELPPPPPFGKMGKKHGKLFDPSKLDKNADGYLSLDEASVLPFMDEEHFKKMDRDGDGRVALDELPLPPPSCPDA